MLRVTLALSFMLATGACSLETGPFGEYDVTLTSGTNCGTPAGEPLELLFDLPPSADARMCIIARVGACYTAVETNRDCNEVGCGVSARFNLAFSDAADPIFWDWFVNVADGRLSGTVEDTPSDSDSCIRLSTLEGSKH